MQPLCSWAARRGHHFSIQLLTGPEKHQRSRGEEGTLHALSRGGRKEPVSGEPGAKSKPREAGRELEKRPATLALAVTDLSFPARLWQERTSRCCHGSHRSTARAGAPVRRDEARERAAPLEFPRSCGLGSQGCYTATIVSRPHRGRGENSPRSRHPTPLPAAGDNGGCDRDGRRAGRRLLSAALPLLTARAAASFSADRSADGSQGLLQGLRRVTGNS